MIVATGARLIGNMLVCRQTFNAGTVKDTSDDWNTTSISQSYANTTVYKNSQSTNSGIRLIYGGSDAAEQATDNALVDPIGKFLAQGSISGDTLGKWIVTASATNSGSETITIKEIGMVMCMQDNRGGQEFLLARKVVPPRTVRPGESFTYSMVIDFLGASE